MSARRRAALALVFATLLSARPAAAYFEETALGSRGVALGFSAMASIRDVTAGYWNPAGLADLSGTQVFADYCKPYGVPDLNAGAFVVGQNRWGAGWTLGWHRLGIAGAYAEDVFSISAGRKVSDFGRGHRLAAGATFKFERVGFQPFDVSWSFSDERGDLTRSDLGRVDYGGQSKGSLDAGLLWTTPWRVDLAWVGRDLLEPHFEFIEGSGGGTVPFRNELAASLRWNKESTLTAGWSQVNRTRTSVNLGFEILFYDVFAIRSGLTNLKPIVQSMGSPNDFQYTGGFGVFHQGYFVDAAVYTNRDLGASYRVSVLVPLGPQAAR
jgi:hypothetical protein